MLACEELRGGSYVVRGMESVWWEMGRVSTGAAAWREWRLGTGPCWKVGTSANERREWDKD